MNRKEQRIAIAEYCGTDIYLNDVLSDRVPDYVNDLNAMHKAEDTIPRTKIQKYWEYLKEICTHPTMKAYKIKVGPEVAISATAAQRAEAFLKTIGKWEE